MHPHHPCHGKWICHKLGYPDTHTSGNAGTPQKIYISPKSLKKCVIVYQKEVVVMEDSLFFNEIHA